MCGLELAIAQFNEALSLFKMQNIHIQNSLGIELERPSHICSRQTRPQKNKKHRKATQYLDKAESPMVSV